MQFCFKHDYKNGATYAHMEDTTLSTANITKNILVHKTKYFIPIPQLFLP